MTDRRSMLGAAAPVVWPAVQQLVGRRVARAMPRFAVESGRRADAETDYPAALGRCSDPPVHQAARNGLARPYEARAANRITIDFAHADVVTP